MSDEAVCNAQTGEWEDLVVNIEPSFDTCAGQPPVDVKFPVCNIETGHWEEDYVAMPESTFLETATGPKT